VKDYGENKGTTEAQRHEDTRRLFVFHCAFESSWFKKFTDETLVLFESAMPVL